MGTPEVRGSACRLSAAWKPLRIGMWPSSRIGSGGASRACFSRSSPFRVNTTSKPSSLRISSIIAPWSTSSSATDSAPFASRRRRRLDGRRRDGHRRPDLKPQLVAEVVAELELEQRRQQPTLETPGHDVGLKQLAGLFRPNDDDAQAAWPGHQRNHHHRAQVIRQKIRDRLQRRQCGRPRWRPSHGWRRPQRSPGSERGRCAARSARAPPSTARRGHGRPPARTTPITEAPDQPPGGLADQSTAAPPNLSHEPFEISPFRVDRCSVSVVSIPSTLRPSGASRLNREPRHDRPARPTSLTYPVAGTHAEASSMAAARTRGADTDARGRERRQEAMLTVGTCSTTSFSFIARKSWP